jgi:hypothetical protein
VTKAEFEKEAERLHEEYAALAVITVQATAIFNEFPPDFRPHWTESAMERALREQLWGDIQDIRFERIVYTDRWGYQTYRHKATFTLKGEARYVHRIDHRYAGFLYTRAPLVTESLVSPA